MAYLKSVFLASRPMYRLAVCLSMALIVMAPVPAAAGEPDIQVRLPGDSVISFSPENRHLPAEVAWHLNGQPLSVGFIGIHLETGQDDFSSSCFIHDKSDYHLIQTQWQYPSGLQFHHTVRLNHSPPQMKFSMDPQTPLKDAPGLVFSGGDRIVYREQGRFITLPLSPSRRELSIAAGQLVIHDSATRQGIQISGLPLNSGIRIHGSAEKLEISLPAVVFQRPEQTGGVVIRPYLGSELAMLEGTGLTLAASGTPAAGPAKELAGDSSPAPAVQRWKMWPDERRVFAPLLADPREAIFRGGALWNEDGDLFEDLNFGFDLGIYRYAWAPDQAFSLTCRGIFTARFDFGSESFDLLNTDFVGGLAAGYAQDANAFELFIYHQSSHLGDELIDREERQPIDYGREALRLLWSHTWRPVRLYGGLTYNFHGLPEGVDQKFTLQAGAEYRFTIKAQPVFLAGDFQSREENDWYLNSALQVGVDLGNPRLTANRQYIFTEFFNGYSNMGQYWDHRERYFFLGLGYQFR